MDVSPIRKKIAEKVKLSHQFDTLPISMIWCSNRSWWSYACAHMYFLFVVERPLDHFWSRELFSSKIGLFFAVTFLRGGNNHVEFVIMQVYGRGLDKNDQSHLNRRWSVGKYTFIWCMWCVVHHDEVTRYIDYCILVLGLSFGLGPSDLQIEHHSMCPCCM